MRTKLAERSSDLARFVERQMRNWELARAQRPGDGRAPEAPVADFICISREMGAGGAEIGTIVGRRLGWPVFNREILHFMADDNAVRERIYASMDERDLGWCEESLRALMEPEFVKNDYFHRLCSTVLTLARQGPAVFLGRGADLILPPSAGLRIRVIAPMARRIERVVQQQGLSEEQARTMIERAEQERTAFIRRRFDANLGDPLRYDLVLNLQRFSLPQAVELILEAHKLLTGPRSTAEVPRRAKEPA